MPGSAPAFDRSSLRGRALRLIVVILLAALPCARVRAAAGPQDDEAPDHLTPAPAPAPPVLTTPRLGRKGTGIPRELAAEIAPLAASLRQGESQAGRPFPLARLELLRARTAAELLASTHGFGAELARDRLDRSIERLEALLQTYAQGGDPWAGRTGRMEGAYLSGVDGSVQPFWLYIPPRPAPGPRGGTGIPLVVLYHGYVPGYTRTNWMEISPLMADALERAGMAMLLTFGRGNTDFLGPGEVDTFEALAAVKKRYPIDEGRTYLAGYSMGGSGVWTTLAHHPGVFAAGRIWSGRTDYYYWHELERAEVPAYLRVVINANNPVDLAENLKAVPLYVRHPLDDVMVKPGHTERLVSRLRDLGRTAPLAVDRQPGEGHWGFVDDLDDPDVYRALLAHRRGEAPDQVEIATFTPQHGTRAWLRIEELAPWGSRAYVRARVERPPSAPPIVHVEAVEHVRVLAVHRADLPPRDADREGAPAVDPLAWRLPAGLRAERLAPAGSWSRVLVHPRGEEVARGPLRKTPGLCGPFMQVLQGRFLVVEGTGSTQAGLLADQFVATWRAYAQGEARRVRDHELRPEDLDQYHLICTGSPDSNAFLGHVADRLPIRFFEDGYAVGDARVRARPSQRLGLLAVYPNPEAPDRLLVVMDGLFYGEHLPINHKWDLVPDYIVFDRGKGMQGANRALLAGHFDSDWQASAAPRTERRP